MPNMKLKHASIFALVFVAVLLATPACNSKNKTSVKTKKKSAPKGPQFRKDGEVWIIKPETTDTIAHFDAEYAISAQDQNYGMMYRKNMDDNMSMLFFRDRLEMQSFWMKNTYVSLDIIYLDEKKRIVSIQKNAEPLNTRSLPSTGPALYVLEIKGGLSDAYGIKQGDIMAYKDVAKNE